jgi:hypothetical protein
LGIHRVVFGLAAMARLQREGMAEDAGHPGVGTASSQPLPGKKTLDGH